MEELMNIIGRLEPGAALSAVAAVLKRLLADLDDEARMAFLLDVLEKPADDKVSSLVHL